MDERKYLWELTAGGAVQKGETCAYKWVTREELKLIPDLDLMSTVERDMVFKLDL